MEQRKVLIGCLTNYLYLFSIFDFFYVYIDACACICIYKCAYLCIPISICASFWCVIGLIQ